MAYKITFTYLEHKWSMTRLWEDYPWIGPVHELECECGGFLAVRSDKWDRPSNEICNMAKKWYSGGRPYADLTFEEFLTKLGTDERDCI